MHETTDTNALVAPQSTTIRELNKGFYSSFYIEAESTTDAYNALAKFAAEVEADGGIIESVAPAFHFEDTHPFQLLVTVAR